MKITAYSQKIQKRKRQLQSNLSKRQEAAQKPDTRAYLLKLQWTLFLWGGSQLPITSSITAGK